MSLRSIRREYRGQPLVESAAAGDPFEQFNRWFEEARTTEPDATAMTLATATPLGYPSARMVLLKGFDARGFVFYTNYESRKATELERTERAALLFYWPTFERQVRIEGTVVRVPDAESDEYFTSRPLESRWSAAASPQSQPIAGREELEAAVAAVRIQQGESVGRPPFWGGYRVTPLAFEFWQGRENRLHDRLAYALTDGVWRRTRLAP
jgi:pyridoxamine 5'-phosphate oxidase